MKRRFRGFYGSSASIQLHRDGTATLVVFCGGKRHRKTYASERGARIALGKWDAQGWTEIKEGK